MTHGGADVSQLSLQCSFRPEVFRHLRGALFFPDKERKVDLEDEGAVEFELGLSRC